MTRRPARLWRYVPAVGFAAAMIAGDVWTRGWRTGTVLLGAVVVLVVAAYAVLWARPGLWHRIGAYLYLWAVVGAGAIGTVLLAVTVARDDTHDNSGPGLGLAIFIGVCTLNLAVLAAALTRHRLRAAAADGNEVGVPSMGRAAAGGDGGAPDEEGA